MRRDPQVGVGVLVVRGVFKALSRSEWAPWIATAPKTAIAPVAATPIPRARAALSSTPATCATAPVTCRASLARRLRA